MYVLGGAMIDRGRALCTVVLLTGSALGCGTSPDSTPTTAVPVSQAQAVESTPPALSLIDQRLRAAWPDNQASTAWFESGGYQIYARHPGDFVAIRAPTVGAVDDVVLSGTFRKVGGPPGGGYGLIVRDRRASKGNGLDQSGQFVVAGVGDRGQIGIWRRDNDQWRDLIPWTDSSSVHPGNAANELTVDVSSSQLRFDVNGVHVASLESPLATGRVGIFVGGDLNEVLVERLVVRPLPSAAQTDLAAKEQELSFASSRLNEVSAHIKSSSGLTTEHDVRWREELGDVLDTVQQVSRDMSADYAGVGRQTERAQRVTSLLSQLEGDVAVALEGLSDGFDGPRSPVTNRAVLERSAAHLESAGHTAEQIRAEVEAFRGDLAGERR
jgi:hypothetical protein